MDKKVYIYSRGGYESLDKDFLSDKAIIRIHNVTDKIWYEDHVENGIVLFFDDLKLSNLTKIERIILKKIYIISDILERTQKKQCVFSHQQALKINNFIKENQNKDFVIHCQYGRSRSVAVGMFLNQTYGHKFANKKAEDLKNANDLVLELLNKNYKL